MFNRLKHVGKIASYQLSRFAGLINGGGFTAWGIFNALKFLFDADDFSRPEVCIPVALFALSSLYVIEGTRSIILHHEIFNEEYDAEPGEEYDESNEFDETLSNCNEHCNTSCCTHTQNCLAQPVSYGIYFSAASAVIANTLLTTLNTATIYEIFYKIFEHLDDPVNTLGEDIFSVSLALLSLPIFLSFNIRQTVNNTKKFKEFLQGKYRIPCDRYLVGTICIMGSNTFTSLLLSYFSMSHALPGMPFGIGKSLQINLIKFLSAYACFTLVITTTTSNTTSVYCFLKKGNKQQIVTNNEIILKLIKRRKIALYIVGILDCTSTTIGTLVGYCFTLKNLTNTSANTDDIFNIKNFINEFGGGALGVGIVFSIFAGLNNFTFSIMEGFSRAEQIRALHIIRNFYKDHSSMMQLSASLAQSKSTSLLEPLLVKGDEHNNLLEQKTIDQPKSPLVRNSFIANAHLMTNRESVVEQTLSITPSV